MTCSNNMASNALTLFFQLISAHVFIYPSVYE